MSDQTLTCSDCGQQFTFTASEQEFFQSKGFSTRVAARTVAPPARPRNSGSSYGGGGGYGGERQMYPAVCAQCGKDTQVPFQPRGDKPVYCSDCYRQQQGGSSSYGNRSGGRRY